MNYKNDLEPIDKEALEKLKRINDLTGILPSKIFNHVDDAPEDLNSNIIGLWFSAKDYKAKPENVKWVLESCKKLLKEALGG